MLYNQTPEHKTMGSKGYKYQFLSNSSSGVTIINLPGRVIPWGWRHYRWVHTYLAFLCLLVCGCSLMSRSQLVRSTMYFNGIIFFPPKNSSILVYFTQKTLNSAVQALHANINKKSQNTDIDLCDEEDMKNSCKCAVSSKTIKRRMK